MTRDEALAFALAYLVLNITLIACMIAGRSRKP
jgi:hypothetical protein